MPVLSTSFGLRGLPALPYPQVVRLETAEEWASFLSSPEARTLCRQRLPLGASRPFQLEANVPRFGEFLAARLGCETPAPAGR
jgi:hypothetical protein